MAKTKRLYANNAKTTLAATVASGDTTITVVDGSAFPNPNTSAGEYFLATLDAGSVIEIVKVTGRTGNTFTGVVRAQEGTMATSFGVGSKIDNRVTRDTLTSFLRSVDVFDSLATVDQLIHPSTMDANTYLMTTDTDGYGNPIVAVRSTTPLWRFTTHTYPVLSSGTVASATTTSIASTDMTVNTFTTAPTTGKYILVFQSGALAGYARILNSAAAGACGWVTALPLSPSGGDTFDIYKANAALLKELLDSADDALLYSIILGE